MDWTKLSEEYDGSSTIITLIMIMIIIYYVFALYYSYKIFSYFKMLFIQQYGDIYQQYERDQER
jgi:hypothetical protein